MPLYGEQYIQFQDAESCRTERKGQALLERQWIDTKLRSLRLGWPFLALTQTCCLPTDCIQSRASGKLCPLRHRLHSSFSLQLLCWQACSWWDQVLLWHLTASASIFGEDLCFISCFALPNFLTSVPAYFFWFFFSVFSFNITSCIASILLRGLSFLFKKITFSSFTVLTATTGFLISYFWINAGAYITTDRSKILP